MLDAGKIRRLYVNDKQHGQLVKGQLAIVKLGERYELVTRETAEKIRQRDPAFVVLLNDQPPPEDPDDPYADYKVPDDLIW